MGYSKTIYQEYIQEQMVNESMRAELHWMEQEYQYYIEQQRLNGFLHTRRPQVG